MSIAELNGINASTTPGGGPLARKALRSFLPLLAVAVLLLSRVSAATATQDIRFSQQIRPILSENCFKCHGVDDKARKSKLRLDDPAVVVQPAKSGARAIVPGKPEESELIKRIFSEDADEVMPPPATKKVLSAEQKNLLREWIASGARYESHWAFVPPQSSPLPRVKQANWVKNGIDHFVLARLEKEGIAPSPRASLHTLVRRLYLDLLGLPPTPEEADAFVNDASSEAYENLVDRLLASPLYGERWARRWLDLARYADTNGYEKDRARSIWPYRDWVIRALNDDMPFDQFTIRQLAGDMLPEATPQDRIATGFHRNTMLNEEGGIDPLEFRFHAVVDRVGTTATAWLGLTLGCAQCHTHKYDPITQREYYQVMAYFNNSDEPDLPVPDASIAAKRQATELKIRELEENLADNFAVPDLRWDVPEATTVSAPGKTERLTDGSWRFSAADKSEAVFEFTTEDAGAVRSIRLEVVADSLTKSTGHSDSGNFVLTDFQISVNNPPSTGTTNTLKLARARADFAQKGFPVSNAIDGNPKTGWAVDPRQRQDHWAVFEFEHDFVAPAGTHWKVRLSQEFGGNHVFARARLSLGRPIVDSRPIEVRRREAFTERFAAWDKEESEKAIHWTVLRPVEAVSPIPTLTILEDNSILASGDQSKSDTYEVKYAGPLQQVTAFRLEALPHSSLPNNGPGRTYYEGPKGDFFLSEFNLILDGKPVVFKKATEDYARNSMGNNRVAAELTYDKDPATGWSTTGGEGKPHAVVYIPSEPLEAAEEVKVKMIFERHFACGLGRFRLSFTTDGKAAEARGFASDTEAILAKPAGSRSDAEKKHLLSQFMNAAPELADARQEIQKQRENLAAAAFTLVMTERPPAHPRKTQVHNRGEYLQPKEEVTAGLPAILASFAPGPIATRLDFARWLVSTNNPLGARVAVNRQWQAFFGRGLVRTLEDFGFQGSPPSHPELLDWLAVEFVRGGWSMKKLHRLIVLSAVYGQSSAFREDLANRDPQNVLLARGPRFRVEAEIVRDAALRASGLLSSKMFGPSVFPAQPANVTTEGAYGPLAWKTSTGEDRYRRSLYTYAKRTAPFAMFNTFDGPTGEACVARREVSNTPLQSLTLLNDVSMVEAARALGKLAAAHPGGVEEKLALIFRRCVTRRPNSEEQAELARFFQTQRDRLAREELNSAKLAGEEAPIETAAWITVARAVLNLDEVITKE